MRIVRCFITGLMLTLVIGCATSITGEIRNIAFIDGSQLIAEGNYEAGLIKLEQAAREEPENKEIRSVLARQREVIIGQLLFDADNTRLSGDLDFAEQKYMRVLNLVPQNQRAKAGLDALNRDRQHIAAIDYAQALLARNDLVEAEKTVRAVLQENPMQPNARALIKQINARMVRTEDTGLTLKTAFRKPLTIEFRDTDLKSVFEIMARTAGINFIFDKDIRKESKVSIFVRDNSIEDVLQLLLMTNQLAYKELNDNSLLIYPNTPAKKKEYQELVVRSFHVAHTEVKQMVAMIRGLVKAKDIYVNEKLNLFIMRDTREAIHLVGRLVALNDLPEPEVMLDVEILEISRDKVLKLGPDFPQSVTFSAVPGAGAVAVPFDQFVGGLKNFTVNNQVLIDLRKTLTQGDILANPRIRVKNREQAKILIGDRIPIITTNITGTAATVSQQVNYIDVGLKLDVEPIISLSNDVSIKVLFEISTADDRNPPQIGTRTAETLMSLRDGETQILAGLIRDVETKIFAGIPGLIDLPVLGRIFSSQNLIRRKTEIVLMITPHIVRNMTYPTNPESEFHFGTANDAGKLPIKISKTAAQSLALSTSGAGTGGRSGMSRLSSALSPSSNGLQVTPNPFARIVSAGPTLTIAAPKNIGLDKEFSVRVRLAGAKASVASEFELNFDTSMLELVGTKEKSGTNSIKLGKGEASGMTQQLRFKVITANPGETEISILNVTAEDKESGESIEVALPPAASINIQP